ncbi:hypothetical protein CEXT_463991 [Caerostris extrusa]|uniref:Uncharacterized protein n=1 Tax=Caerostris extrusa TaxID=172846 RepID=A0AAV4M6Z2_CAEEX|nr:hypothetical protein CEXT_463991 [Caerostris extrusa]
MHLSVLATRAHAERPMQKHHRATKAEFHPSPGSERNDLRSPAKMCPNNQLLHKAHHTTTGHASVSPCRPEPRRNSAERQKQNSTPLQGQKAVTCYLCGDVSQQPVTPRSSSRGIKVSGGVELFICEMRDRRRSSFGSDKEFYLCL